MPRVHINKIGDIVREPTDAAPSPPTSDNAAEKPEPDASTEQQHNRVPVCALLITAVCAGVCAYLVPTESWKRVWDIPLHRREPSLVKASLDMSHRRRTLVEIPPMASLAPAETHPSAMYVGRVSILNTDGNYLAFCVEPEAETLPPFSLGSACGGATYLQLSPEVDGDHSESAIQQGAHMTVHLLRESSDLAESSLGKKSLRIVAESHNRIMSATIEATVEVTVHGSRSTLPFSWYYLQTYLPILAREFRAALLYVRNYNWPPWVHQTWKTVVDKLKFLQPKSCIAVLAHYPELAKASRQCTEFVATLPFVGSYARPFCTTLFSGHYISGVLIVVCIALYPMLTIQKAGLSLTKSSLKRCLTSMFAHANEFHLACNASVILSIGPELSSTLDCNTLVWVCIYVCGGFFGCWSSLLWKKMSANKSFTVGASGAITAICVALLVLRPHATINVMGYTAGSPAAFIAFMFVKDLILNAVFNSHIDVAAHFGGGIGGFVAASALLMAAGAT